MIILYCSRQVISRNIFSFLCSCIITDVYRACVISFRSEFLLYNQINFDFDKDIDWISKHIHNSDIKNSSMKVMLIASVSIRARNWKILSRLFKMTSTMNDLISKNYLICLKIRKWAYCSLSRLWWELVVFQDRDDFMNLSEFEALQNSMLRLLAFETKFFLH